MSKNFELKQETLAKIVDRFQKAHSVVIVSYTGITVETITDLRNQFRAAGVEYVVLKNTLVRRALEQLNIQGLDKELNGPSAFAFGMTDAVAPAKIVCEFIKKSKNDNLAIKAGIVDNKVIGINEVKALAELPPREVLVAKMLGSLNAPITGLVGVLSATLSKLVYALDAIVKAKTPANE